MEGSMLQGMLNNPEVLRSMLQSESRHQRGMSSYVISIINLWQ